VSLASDAMEVAQLFAYLGLAAVAIRTWRRQGGPAAAWPAATFVVLGAVAGATSVLPVHSEREVVIWARKVVLAGLFLFPYFLYRFTAAFGRPRPRADRTAASLTVAVLTATAWVPSFLEEGEPRPGWLVPYLAVAVLQWSVLSVTVAVRLWRAGRGQAALARRRMSLMALGSVVLDVALLVAVSAPSEPHPGRTLATQLLGLLGAGLFYVGFSPPAVLRILWRHPEVRLLRQAEVGLMAALDTEEVTAILLPRLTALFGGKGTALVDGEGRVTASHGLTPEEAAVVAGATDRSDVISAPMSKGRLVVQASPYAPFFGQEEDNLAHGLALFADLALARSELLSQERSSRQQAEAANAELETFVYTVSHDLKSPLVSLSWFLELVRTELGAQAPGDVPSYLDRMEAGTRYMHDLIGDLLELARIGRVQTEIVDVDLARVVEEVVDELRPAYPVARFGVAPLPVVAMNPLRARQLFTNLLGNAVAHSGRADVHVEVGCDLRAEGLRLVVADDGRGIPAQHRERVFMVFEQLDGPAERAGAGTGIGLAVCRKIVEQAGGCIGALDVVAGAAFEIKLPSTIVRLRADRMAAAS
jgi:signal transduction histidine kinase